MKRASTKKVNAIPVCPVRQDASEGHLSPVPLEVNRRVRTSAAMIGLAISMGASSFLLTRQSDRALAAEPVANKLTVTTVPVDQEDAAYAVAPTNQVVSEVISSGSAVTSSSAVVPITQGTPTRSVVVKPMVPGINQPVQVGPTLWQLSQYQVDAGEITAYNNLTEQSDLQAEQVLQVPVANEAIQEASADRTAEISKPYAVVPNQIEQPTSPKAAGEINTLLKAKQAVALKALRHKSNRLQNSLAEWRSEESRDNEAAVTQGAMSASKSEKAQIATSDKGVTTASLDKASEELALKVDASNTAFNLSQKSEELPSAVAEPTAVVPGAELGYHVRKGDTLSTIAHNYGITLAELVNVNHLTNPNRLQINQRLVIPASEPSLLADRQPIAENKSWQDSPRPASSVTTGGLKQADKGSVATVSAAPLAETPSTQLGIAKIPAIAPIRQSEKLSAKPELQPNPYVENLRLEILRLREKYQAQQTEAQAGAVGVPISVPAPSTAAMPSRPNTLEFRVNQQVEPTNPEFLPGQLPLTSESTRYPATASPQVATAPLGVNAFDSLQSLRGRQVSPELPPLAAVDRYLPKPFDASTPFKAGFIWPAKGLLTSGFGWRWGRMHKGIDIAAPIGTPVVAAAAGVVVSAGWNSGGYGNLVDIQHSDGSLTRYAHNNRILVRVGQQVEQGEQISEMGSTGYSTGPHCHFEVHPSGRGAVNPIAFLPGHSS